MKTNYTAASIAKALIVDGLMSWAIWAGWGQDIEGARNVVTLVLWLMFAISLLYWSDEIRKHMQDRPRKVPEWVSGIFWAAWILFLTWHGSWVLAVAMLITWLGLSRVDPKAAANAGEQA